MGLLIAVYFSKLCFVIQYIKVSGMSTAVINVRRGRVEVKVSGLFSLHL